MSQYLITEMETTPNIQIRYQVEVVNGAGSDNLEHLVLRDNHTEQEDQLPADGLFVLIGAEPNTDWLGDVVERDDWGFIRTGRDVQAFGRDRAPYSMETGLPGVFAVGDVRRGSAKRVASAVGAGAIAIQQVHQSLSERHEPS